jgi:hypothetical protein
MNNPKTEEPSLLNSLIDEWAHEQSRSTPAETKVVGDGVKVTTKSYPSGSQSNNRRGW